MSKFSLNVFLSSTSDTSSSGATNLNNFKWSRSINSLTVDAPLSRSLSLAPGESSTIFSGSRTLTSDGTTVFSISLKAGTTNTYTLAWVSGTVPAFRTARTTSADATTVITSTINGPLVTYTSTAGTALNLSGVSVGDYVTLGSSFNVNNQGEYLVLGKTSTSFTVSNSVGVAEVVTMGSLYASSLLIYSAAGVQVEDVLSITGGFSSVSWNTYDITAVTANYVEFTSTATLPAEASVQTNSIAVYNDAKSLIYVEADQYCTMTINGVAGSEVRPFVVGSGTQPGIFLRTSTIYSLSIANAGLTTANIYVAAVE